MVKERSNAAVIVIGSAPVNAERRKGAWSKEKACSKGMAKDGECGVYGRSCSGVPPKDKELKLGAKQRKTPVDVGEVAKAKDNKTCI